MGVYVNRILNMKHIKAIGLDMDYTLVRYDSKAFEQLTYDEIQKKLIKNKNYPQSISKLKFDFDLAIRGLVIDKTNGNLLKTNLHGKIKQSFHGNKQMNYHEQQQLYRGLIADLNHPNYSCIDTTFSIAYAVIYCQLVELKDLKPDEFPSYEKMEEDVLEMLDLAHRDDSLKGVIRKNIKKYIVKDPTTVKVLRRFKQYGKKIWVITNSDFHYTKLLLDYTITPYLDKGETWSDLFDIVITSAQKPGFFTESRQFLEIDINTGYLKNSIGPYTQGVFQGGCAQVLQKDNNFHGEDILYLGDHIYGDILSLKKACNWRTALVIEELAHEVGALESSRQTAKDIDKAMRAKIKLEKEIDKLYIDQIETQQKNHKEKLTELFKEIEKTDKKLTQLITKYQTYYNARWGEVMRAGQDPSRFAGQVDKYACIYMSKVSDLIDYSPRTYFRPRKRPLAHELG
jgi:HAD superfamily 5'-nucleotidase-like hydrolase